ncbi:putative Phytocyanin domain, cupredoxin [Helianthus annuus]|uniref:Phytocyanin domain, cupredoxin n=1 Tax=Helianthus annuus TaxID=4232 RepID=A0A251S0G0_HELAN|nr:mavicyanin [Helianthus annuus]KAF5760567.1 putative Phytocyanin domain, cupredoxin [Helianthus annuus]KAJ0438584.1 putative Phytocyanin domain, cupredoxin [Helianthus annuus]KAJ0443409.1 putative Phytocyanin domain, cupredoxin [Helianthus annuus]KAJ0460924.1 putative Phytocyanin domain, cupredoxin [Helianthus annuus]KAJ0641355.1 putative Phytocyanin domain, cupredoxin [Helianthus annuus]
MAVEKWLVVLFTLTVVTGGTLAGAQVVHHVVSGDHASDTSTDIGSWSSGRTFRVGDSLLFRYLPPQEMIVELASMEEYYSCDLTNPIKMYTDLENQVPLEKEGIRYFASASYEKCKNGVKLPVQVKPREVTAYGPSPSSAAQLNRLLALTLIGLFVYGFYFI